MKLTVSLLLFLLLSSSVLAQETWFSDKYVDYDLWHQTRIGKLTSADGYLTLVGLHWLRQEKPTDIEGIGRCWMEGEEAVIECLPGFEFEGQEAGTVRLDSKLKEGTQRVKKESLSYYVIKRGKRYALRVKDSKAFTRQSFRGVPRFRADSRWRFYGKLEKRAENVDISSVVGTTDKEKSPGWATFLYDGEKHRALLLGEPQDQKFFLVFSDKTAGKTTYPACRFLSVERYGAEGLVLDFNKATNPACAFTHFATCPLPPAENRFPFAIPAGEKVPLKP